MALQRIGRDGDVAVTSFIVKSEVRLPKTFKTGGFVPENCKIEDILSLLFVKNEDTLSLRIVKTRALFP